MTIFPQRAHTAKLTQRIKNKRYVSYVLEAPGDGRGQKHEERGGGF